jgi:ankyrin repeat protein
MEMLTIEEVLSDVASSPGFGHLKHVDINSRGESGQSALHWMAVLGDTKGIKLLIDAGIDVDIADNEGNTALHEAVIWYHTSAVYELIKMGANQHLKNNNGLTPLDIAKADNFESIQIALKL